MTVFKRTLNIILLLCLANFLLLFGLVLRTSPLPITIVALLMLIIWFIIFNIKPRREKQPNSRLTALIGGYELFVTVGWCSLAEIVIYIIMACSIGWQTDVLWGMLTNLLLALPILFLTAANAFFRLLFTSSQLRVVWRVLLVLFWWFPLLNLYIFRRACHIVKSEYYTELSKLELDNLRAENEMCKTKYPIVLVHGIFFRDWQLINYWGRIPRELIRNGAEIYYGGQQSAASVVQSAKELKETILKVLAETGADKVNLIAHSKGGLDSRYAISQLGLTPHVASLTTINTPHRGCIFAQTLLKMLPKGIVMFIANKYNSVFHTLGDPNPDFLAGVTDLTADKCAQFNRDIPDAPGVLYQSVMSVMKHTSSAPPPLNLTYLIVKKYDKEPNDGLVSRSSAHWGRFLGEPVAKGRRGISHGDIIDLMRENIPGFDVREFYVKLVSDLKKQRY